MIELFGAPSGSPGSIKGFADATGPTEVVSMEPATDLPGVYRGMDSRGPSLGTTDAVAWYFDSNDMNDLWLAVTWKKTGY